MPKQKTTIEIPLELARMLLSEPSDMKEGVKYEDVQAVAKALLRVLVANSKL